MSTITPPALRTAPDTQSDADVDGPIALAAPRHRPRADASAGHGGHGARSRVPPAWMAARGYRPLHRWPSVEHNVATSSPILDRPLTAHHSDPGPAVALAGAGAAPAAGSADELVGRRRRVRLVLDDRAVASVYADEPADDGGLADGTVVATRAAAIARADDGGLDPYTRSPVSVGSDAHPSAAIVLRLPSGTAKGAPRLVVRDTEALYHVDRLRLRTELGTIDGMSAWDRVRMRHQRATLQLYPSLMQASMVSLARDFFRRVAPSTAFQEILHRCMGRQPAAADDDNAIGCCTEPPTPAEVCACVVRITAEWRGSGELAQALDRARAVLEPAHLCGRLVVAAEELCDGNGSADRSATVPTKAERPETDMDATAGRCGARTATVSVACSRCDRDGPAAGQVRECSLSCCPMCRSAYALSDRASGAWLLQPHRARCSADSGCCACWPTVRTSAPAAGADPWMRVFVLSYKAPCGCIRSTTIHDAVGVGYYVLARTSGGRESRRVGPYLACFDAVQAALCVGAGAGAWRYALLAEMSA